MTYIHRRMKLTNFLKKIVSSKSSEILPIEYDKVFKSKAYHKRTSNKSDKG